MIGNRGDFFVVDDLCGLIADCPEKLTFMNDCEIHAVACYPRAIEALFAFAGIKPKSLTVHNLRKFSPAEILDKLPETETKAELPEQAQNPGKWIPWYPVLEKSRCTECGQCMDFCPFDVYDRDPETGIRPARPHNCKNECPACARICPELAIIFPKHPQSPVNGDEIRESDKASRAIPEELNKKLQEQGIHAVLEKRKQSLSEKRLNREQASRIALEERTKCKEKEKNS